jgi:hypothetical protein
MSSKKVECLFVMRCILTKPHAETEKDPRFNGIANAAHCHP